MSETSTCFHCHGPVPSGVDVGLCIDGVLRPMCCPGCKAVAEAILDADLGDYYQARTAAPRGPARPRAETLDGSRVYDDPRVQSSFVATAANGECEVRLLLEGLVCAACVWLSERTLQALPGVRLAEVNYSTRRARVRWDPTRASLSHILDAMHAIGYAAHPYDAASRGALLEAERRTALKRLGLAVALGMQVMMIAIALYAGAITGISDDLRVLLVWVSALLTVPVVVYSARPFLLGALRDVRDARVGMDVPITLGLTLAFAGSLHAAWTGRGEVYFDSVVMFTAFVLGARYIEAGVMRRSIGHLEALLHAAPVTARRLRADGGAEQRVLAVDLCPGEQALVLPGETVPVDGRIVEGRSHLDESLLTGESMPRARGVGDEVSGGSINVEGPLTIEVLRASADSLLARIVTLVEAAGRERPALLRLADRVAAHFLTGVLVLAVVVACAWLVIAPERWLQVTVAVLVATCPCALSLATPAALAAGGARLARDGLVPARRGGLETLARATHVFLDKTGTLSEGRPRLVAQWAADGEDPACLLNCAAALERRSEHPLGRALLAAAGATARVGPAATGVDNTPGQGLSGRVAGTCLWLGSAEFVAAACGVVPPVAAREQLARSAGSVAWLASAERVLAGFACRDALRSDAHALVRALRASGLQVGILSGDNAAEVARVAAELGVDSARGELDPQGKITAIAGLQARGAVVVVVGDGVNDAPVLAAAQVSVAMGGGTALARASSDWVLLNDRLQCLADGMAGARHTMAVVRQNMIWALGYNCFVLPAAALGLLAPWQAALGMSASSVLVVLNAARLARRAKPLSGMAA